MLRWSVSCRMGIQQYKACAATSRRCSTFTRCIRRRTKSQHVCKAWLAAGGICRRWVYGSCFGWLPQSIGVKTSSRPRCAHQPTKRTATSRRTAQYSFPLCSRQPQPVGNRQVTPMRSLRSKQAARVTRTRPLRSRPATQDIEVRPLQRTRVAER